MTNHPTGIALDILNAKKLIEEKDLPKFGEALRLMGRHLQKLNRLQGKNTSDIGFLLAHAGVFIKDLSATPSQVPKVPLSERERSL